MTLGCDTFPCARKSFRPAGIEHVFAARVALEVAGRGGKERALSALHKQMLRLPSGAPAG